MKWKHLYSFLLAITLAGIANLIYWGRPKPVAPEYSISGEIVGAWYVDVDDAVTTETLEVDNTISIPLRIVDQIALYPIDGGKREIIWRRGDPGKVCEIEIIGE